ncbi:MAG: PspC domain-containing protein [Candidatus Pacebacteria bacterium]|nr:PspC domain-containing protein [Candidatus Paceibacterota bacterium]
MAEEMKKLHRSKNEKVIAGVAGGLGEYFGIDPVLFRILFVFLILWGGAGILFYLILMFIIPSQNGQSAKDAVKEAAFNLKEKAQEVAGGIKQEAQEMKEESWWSNRRNVLGVVIMLAGLVFLLNQLFPIRFLKFNFIWPVVIIFIGFFVILKRH